MGNFSAKAMLAVSGFFVCSVGVAQIPEIPVYGLSGIARVQMTSRGPVIYYNPATVRQIGPSAWAFFRAHEYAHVQLGHFHRNISHRQAEAEADTYAAKTASPRAVAAAKSIFLSGRGGSAQHGSAMTRAARLSAAQYSSGQTPQELLATSNRGTVSSYRAPVRYYSAASSTASHYRYLSGQRYSGNKLVRVGGLVYRPANCRCGTSVSRPVSYRVIRVVR